MNGDLERQRAAVAEAAADLKQAELEQLYARFARLDDAEKLRWAHFAFHLDSAAFERWMNR